MRTRQADTERDKEISFQQCFFSGNAGTEINTSYYNHVCMYFYTVIVIYSDWNVLWFQVL